MAYTVKLDVFEGPLDLLLHLISKAEMDIEDISVSDITQQYLDYLAEMKRFDIEIASEFLVMASTLVYIKSCNLVPRKKTTSDDKEEYEDDIDSEEALIRKLIEYKKYKEMGEKLKDRENTYMNVYYKEPEYIVMKGIDDNLLYGLTKYDLLNTFNRLMLLQDKREEANNKREHVVKKDHITVKERMYQLKRLLNTKDRLSFFGLFEKQYEKTDVIITFLALLDLIREDHIELYQEKLFGDIIIRKRG